MDLRTNGDFCPIQHQLIGFWNLGGECIRYERIIKVHIRTHIDVSTSQVQGYTNLVTLIAWTTKFLV